MAASKAKSRPVLVTTAHRGVFVGHTTEEEKDATITLTDARMVVYWPAENRGVLGLAAEGPKRGAKVSPAVARLKLKNVTAVMDATPEAAKAWSACPWG